MKHIKIIEVCSELGAAQLGASMGADAIHMAAHKDRSDFFAQHDILRLPDRNHLLALKNHHQGCQHAKRLRYILENCLTVCNTVTNVLETNNFPLVLSADHSSAAGTIAGIKQAYPNERLGVIWIDAHSDMHSPYTTHSGNMHGMPLGAALGLDAQARISLSEAANLLPLSDQCLWNHLKALGGITPHIRPEDLALIGVRFFKPEHRILIDDLAIKLYTIKEIREKGAAFYAKQIEAQLRYCSRLYISFDVDSLDCDVVSYGTGTPEPNGLYINEALTFIKTLTANPKVCCLEIAEVNPVLDDKGNAMAEAAWQMIKILSESV